MYALTTYIQLRIYTYSFVHSQPPLKNNGRQTKNVNTNLLLAVS